MSLTSIRTYGWLTGTTKQIRNIGTYGWFAAAGPPPVFPVGISSILQVPLSWRADQFLNYKIPVDLQTTVTPVLSEKKTPIDFNRSIFTYKKSPFENLKITSIPEKSPVDIQSEAIVVTSNKAVPIERISGLLVFDNLSTETISQFSKNQTVLVNTKLNITSDFNISNDYLLAINQFQRTPIENQSESIIVSSYKSIPIGHLLHLSDKEKSIIEWGGTTIYVNAVKFVPVESLTNVIIFPSIPIEEMDFPLAWYLDERGVLWVLDERTTQWIMDYRSVDWTQSEQLRNWILDYRSIWWKVEDVQ